MTDFPVHEDLTVQEGETIFKSDEWWKAIVLYDGYRGLEVAVYLWQHRDDSWRRQQKYVIRSQEDWEQDRTVIEELVTAL